MFRRGIGKGILLLIVTNILVMVMLGVVLSVLSAAGLMPQGYVGVSMVVALVYGFGAAFFSLAISRYVAKKFMGVQVINPQSSGQYDFLVQMVHQQAKAAGLPAMPEVGVYDSPEVNAFATGPSKRKSLVAFSSGMLQSMSRDEIEGVSAHEVAHIQNGDMFAMTLLQGLVNAFAVFFARMIASVVASRVDSAGARMVVHIVVYIVAQLVFLLLGSIVVAWFSRKREFRADAGSAKLAGRNKMIAALERLKRDQKREIPDDRRIPEGVAALGINGRRSKFSKLFSTHPPLDERIARLQSFS